MPIDQDTQNYLDGVQLTLDAMKNDVGQWKVEVNPNITGVIARGPGGVHKTFQPNTPVGVIAGYVLGYSNGYSNGRKDANAAKEQELRSLLGISEGDGGKLYVSQA